MRKRDRTGEEKHFDAIVKSGLMRLGENPRINPPRLPSEVTQPRQTNNAFPHVLVWDRMGRRGQKCRVITPNNSSMMQVQLQFEDGYISPLINRQALRRSD